MDPFHPTMGPDGAETNGQVVLENPAVETAAANVLGGEVTLTNVSQLFPPTEQFVKRRRSLSVFFRPNVELGKNEAEKSSCLQTAEQNMSRLHNG